ncbi:phosphoribosylglycinamide formyltransferase [Floricoccus penangensis]|uniref:Phosphoribosylglycinamide formyltransferase n=1 Tax=Floricoccus penangensis TaxID=1859475 RepID=A0A9Q5JHJ2_9LACT|nr:phosphoribosylglycinamide formyltransferase [Floricoccus penangensis]OFI47661.1 phosphoribosylglycinamide formyltransferase [Floricoccus penangensis]
MGNSLKRVAVLASGNGSNFEAIIQAVEEGRINCSVELVFSDKPDAYVLERAKNHKIPFTSFMIKDFSSKLEYEQELLRILKENQIDILILAGYMRLIGNELLAAFPQRIINIHPSLLPSFPGLHGIEDAFNYGVKYTGVTVHYVDSGIDTGKIINQAVVDIAPDDDLESLEAKIHQTEHIIYPDTLAKLINKGE